MDNICIDIKRQSMTENSQREFEKKLESFVLNDEFMSIDEDPIYNITSAELINTQRNILPPLQVQDSISMNLKRKSCSSPDRVSINNQTFNEENQNKVKNMFFDEIKETINSNKKEGIRNICKLKNLNEQIKTEDDGSILFYWLDAYEDNSGKGEPLVVLFGKTFNKEKGCYQSISVVMKNLHKKVYILPKLEKINEPNLLENLKMEFEKLNQTKFSYIKKGKYSIKKKKYCLELPIPYNEYKLLKFSYPYEFANIPAGINSGTYFDYIFNRVNHLLENIFLSRKIKGPCWLKLRKYEFQEFNITWSNYEVICNDYKDISILENKNQMNPELKILSFSTKMLTTISDNVTNKKLIALSGNLYNYNLESAAYKNEDSFVYLIEEKDNMNNNHDNSSITFCQNENIILNRFFVKFSTFDPDVIVAHNIYKEQLDDIISKVNILKISENWSKIGRLKKTAAPKYCYAGAGNVNNQMRYFTAGRLICDTTTSLQEIIRENSYSLDFLANRYLIKNRLDEYKHNSLINDNNNLINCGLHALEESRITFELMNKFCILQLNKQLSNISGSLFFKSLQNSRVDRCEMLLLHEMKKNRFIIPDKAYKIMNNFEEFDEDGKEKKKIKLKNYEGGLVLEPKTGFYDQIVLLLDFNSLYPSIIQQYNICFTTVSRKPSQNFQENRKISNLNQSVNNNEEEDNLDLNIIRKTNSKAILPLIIESLINERTVLKENMKIEKDAFKKTMLNIKQTALKLSANSLYGYIGYKSSRFYSKTIAALITKIGRDTLKETVKIVKNIPTINTSSFLDIIYGDTDSIMVNCLTSDLRKALQIGEIIKQRINHKDNILKLEIDHVFKNLLLLRKKKYAGLKYENAIELMKNNFIGEVILEKTCKGLDMIRRDTCELSKEVGIFILDILLNSEHSKEDVINQLYDYLKQLSSNMDCNSIDIQKYVISKQLTKNVEEYQNPNMLLPHLRIARRLKEKGDQSITNGRIITYLICKNKTLKKESLKVSDRAYHLNEFRENKDLEIDIEWYKVNQIHMSVNRLVKHIKEILPERIIESLGLDKKKFHLKENQYELIQDDDNEIIKEINSMILMYSKRGIELKCEHCNYLIRVVKINDTSDNLKELLYCNNCAKEMGDMMKLMNNISLNLKRNFFKYFLGVRRCSKCRNTTKLFLKKKCNEYNCSKGEYLKEYPENEVSNDLAFLNKLFDFNVEMDEKGLLKKHSDDLKIIKEITLNDLEKKIEFNKIDLKSLFGFLKITN